MSFHRRPWQREKQHAVSQEREISPANAARATIAERFKPSQAYLARLAQVSLNAVADPPVTEATAGIQVGSLNASPSTDVSSLESSGTLDQSAVLFPSKIANARGEFSDPSTKGDQRKKNHKDQGIFDQEHSDTTEASSPETLMQSSASMKESSSHRDMIQPVGFLQEACLQQKTNHAAHGMPKIEEAVMGESEGNFEEELLLQNTSSTARQDSGSSMLKSHQRPDFETLEQDDTGFTFSEDLFNTPHDRRETQTSDPGLIRRKDQFNSLKEYDTISSGEDDYSNAASMQYVNVGEGNVGNYNKGDHLNDCSIQSEPDGSEGVDGDDDDGGFKDDDREGDEENCERVNDYNDEEEEEEGEEEGEIEDEDDEDVVFYIVEDDDENGDIPIVDIDGDHDVDEDDENDTEEESMDDGQYQTDSDLGKAANSVVDVIGEHHSGMDRCAEFSIECEADALDCCASGPQKLITEDNKHSSKVEVQHESSPEPVSHLITRQLTEEPHATGEDHAKSLEASRTTDNWTGEKKANFSSFSRKQLSTEDAEEGEIVERLSNSNGQFSSDTEHLAIRKSETAQSLPGVIQPVQCRQVQSSSSQFAMSAVPPFGKTSNHLRHIDQHYSLDASQILHTVETSMYAYQLPSINEGADLSSKMFWGRHDSLPGDILPMSTSYHYTDNGTVSHREAGFDSRIVASPSYHQASPPRTTANRIGFQDWDLEAQLPPKKRARGSKAKASDVLKHQALDGAAEQDLLATTMKNSGLIPTVAPVKLLTTTPSVDVVAGQDYNPIEPHALFTHRQPFAPTAVGKSEQSGKEVPIQAKATYIRPVTVKKPAEGKATYERREQAVVNLVGSKKIKKEVKQKAVGSLPLTLKEKLLPFETSLNATFQGASNQVHLEEQSRLLRPAALATASTKALPGPTEGVLYGFWPSPPPLKTGKGLYPAPALSSDSDVEYLHEDRPRIDIFIDNSNVLYSFLNWVRARPESKVLSFTGANGRATKTVTLNGKKVRIDYRILFALLERGRKVAKRVLVGSSPLWQSLEAAIDWGYEVAILQRVPRSVVEAPVAISAQVPPTQLMASSSDPSGFPNQLTSTAKESMRGISSLAQGPRPAKRTRDGAVKSKNNDSLDKPQKQYKEQAVDELLHLKILESLLDFTPDGGSRPLIVLATGDAKASDYNPNGFLGCVRRALERGWDVEIVAFALGTSSIWAEEAKLRNRMDEDANNADSLTGTLRIIDLALFAEQLVS